MSIRSFAPTVGAGGYAESLLGDVFESGQQSAPWRSLGTGNERNDQFDLLPYDEEEPMPDFSRDFDELDDINSDGSNEGSVPSVS